jgi:hypothetical protein
MDDLFGDLEGGTIRFSPDGRFLLASLGGESGLELFDAKTYGRRTDDSALDVHTITPSGRIYGWDGIYELESGITVANLSSRALHGPIPSRDEHRLLARRESATVVLDGRDASELYSRLEYEGGGALVYAPSLFYDGTPAAIRRTYLVRDRTVLPLDGYAAVLCDPRRIRAAAAGVEIAGVALPDPPRFLRTVPSTRVIDVDAGELSLEAVAEDPRGLSGFEILLDGVPLSSELALASTVLEPEDNRARLSLGISRPVVERSEIRVRAIARSGMLSVPWRTTVVWR